MNKYLSNINLLQAKNKQYERIFEEIKKRDENKHKFTDIYDMIKKLDIVENEMNISKLFNEEKHSSLDNLVHKEKHKHSDDETEFKV